MTRESSLTEVDNVPSPTEMEIDKSDVENIKIIDSSSSTVAQKKPIFQRLFKSFKRRKISSPSVNLSVTERLVNIHEDVLVVKDTVKEVCEKISKLSLSEQVVEKSSESKIQDNTKSLEEEKQKISDAKSLLVNSATTIFLTF